MITNRIAHWRSTKGISKAHLARYVGVSRSFVTKLEKGDAQPGAELMLRIAAYFKQPVEAVFQCIRSDVSKSICKLRIGAGQADAQPADHSARPSSGKGDRNGQIVASCNGEGCGVPVAQ